MRRPRSHRLQDEGGFTLPELLVTIVVLGVIGGYVMTSVVQSMAITAEAQIRTTALTDIERGLERVTRQIRVADPLRIDPDGQCDALATGLACQELVLSRRLDADTFSGGDRTRHSYYLADVDGDGQNVELRQDVLRTDLDTGATVQDSDAEFIADIANLDPVLGQPLFRFLNEDPVTGELVAVDCTSLSVEQCRTRHATASVVEITLMKVVEREPLTVSTSVNIRNTRYEP